MLWQRDQMGSDNPISVKLNVRMLLVINSWQLVFSPTTRISDFRPLFLVLRIVTRLLVLCTDNLSAGF